MRNRAVHLSYHSSALSSMLRYKIVADHVISKNYSSAQHNFDFTTDFEPRFVFFADDRRKIESKKSFKRKPLFQRSTRASSTDLARYATRYASKHPINLITKPLIFGYLS